MILRTRAIVLNHLKYGESGLIATLYTEGRGRMSVLAKKAYGKRAAIRASLFQPLSLLDVSVYYDVRRELQTLREVSLSVPMVSIPFEPAKSSIALFLSEILYKTLREEVDNSDMFGFLYHSFQVLDLAERGVANFHLIFLLQLSKHLGFSPHYLESDSCTDRLSEESFRYRHSPGGDLGADARTNVLLEQLLHSGFDEMGALEMDHLTRNKLIDHLIQWYARHHEGCRNIRSLPVLTSIFSS